MRKRLIAGDCLEVMRSMPAASIDLVVFSPPYALKTRRYDGARRKLTWQEWVAWMADVVDECCRVCSGFVLVNANNPTLRGQEIPANDFLRVALHERGVSCERPVIWHKNAPPNRPNWFSNDYEPVMAFYRGSRPTVWNWEAIATPPKFKSGGAFRQRDSKGNRKAGGAYPQTKLARPRDVLRVTVGGGHLGSPLAHENEAPFPEKLVEPFVLTLSNPGDVVLDPFCGSGTTLAVALRHGRKAIGIDVRKSQIALTRRRLAESSIQAPAGESN